MKKITLLLVFTLLIVFLIAKNDNPVSAATVSGSDLCSNMNIGDTFSNYSVNIPKSCTPTSTEFGSLNYIGTEDEEYTNELSSREYNWLGNVVDTNYDNIEHKYKVVKFQFDNVLDTIGTEFIDGSTSLHEFSPTAEFYNDGIPYERHIERSISGSITRSASIGYSRDLTNSATLSVSVPLEGLTVGGGVSSTLTQTLKSEYNYSDSKQWSVTENYDIYIENKLGSPYYHNGETIYIDHGSRARYYVDLIFVYEYHYKSVFDYSEKNWHLNTINYYNAEAYEVELVDIQVAYSLINLYGGNPFVYYWDSSQNTNVLFENQRQDPGVVYV